MVRGDVNELLARIARLDVRDITITTPDVEDLFLRYYDGQAGAASTAADQGAAAARAAR